MRRDRNVWFALWFSLCGLSLMLLFIGFGGISPEPGDHPKWLVELIAIDQGPLVIVRDTIEYLRLALYGLCWLSIRLAMVYPHFSYFDFWLAAVFNQALLFFAVGYVLHLLRSVLIGRSCIAKAKQNRTPRKKMSGRKQARAKKGDQNGIVPRSLGKEDSEHDVSLGSTKRARSD